MTFWDFIADGARFVWNHWGAITGWLVAAYHVIANAGGCRKIWANFTGPDKPV